MRATLLGIGAMASPRFAPAGLLVAHGRTRVMLDGGPGASPSGRIDAWLLTDDRCELRRDIRRLAAECGVVPGVASFSAADLLVEARPLVHTSHPAFGYRIVAGGRVVIWAPEFFRFPGWAAGADLMFAEAAGFARPILFRNGVGGHMAALDVAREARRAGVRRLVFAHVGRPSIRAMDAGADLPFGRWGVEGRSYRP